MFNQRSLNRWVGRQTEERTVLQEEDPTDMGTRLGALEAFKAAVEKSRGEFSEKLAQHEETLLCFLGVMERAEPAEHDIKAAVLAVHRIAGVAPMFGFAELGGLARNVEAALMDFQAAPSHPKLRNTCLNGTSDLILRIKEVRAGETAKAAASTI